MGRGLNRKRVARAITALAASLVGVVAGAPAASGAPAGPAATLTATLNSAQEISGTGSPNAGDANGLGAASVRVEAADSTGTLGGRLRGVCFQVVVTRLSSAVAAMHIHKAAAGSNGPIVIGLTAPTNGFAGGCIAVDDAALLADLAANPQSYYVNVHTTGFPGGAVRGQLRAGSGPLSSTLSGWSVPNSIGQTGLGDRDAAGVARVVFDAVGRTLCANILLANSDVISLAQLNRGVLGIAGVNIADWTSQIGGSASGGSACSTLTAAIATEMSSFSERFHINLRSANFPLGALRGQLSAETAVRMTAGDGGVFALDPATFYGSTGDIRLNKPIVAMGTSPTGKGYWFAGADGGVFAFGDAPYVGSNADVPLVRPIVGFAPTPSGLGYWMVASDGGVFTNGDAEFYGSAGAIRLAKPIVGMVATPTGRGYWLYATDGGVFTFGDAAFLGAPASLPNRASDIVAMAATWNGEGYWMLAANGQTFTYGNATVFGDGGAPPAGSKYVELIASPDGSGFYAVTSAAQVAGLGSILNVGDLVGTRLNQPVVAASS